MTGTCVVSIPCIVSNKVVDDRSGYDIANVLSIIMLQGLKGNSNTLAPVIECWAPRVACIDGCINLTPKYTSHEFKRATQQLTYFIIPSNFKEPLAGITINEGGK
jgi:hypothetical protein